MITPDLTHCTTLEQFYEELAHAQNEAHGEGYNKFHDRIQSILHEFPFFDYKELGTMQGSSAACALLTGVCSYVEMVDINFTRLDPYYHLFMKFAEDRGITINKKEISSLDKKSVTPCDLLLIDTVHNRSHIKEELRIHAPYVSSYIICHDTKAKPELQSEIVKFCNKNDEWNMIEYYQKNVGYTVLIREDDTDE